MDFIKEIFLEMWGVFMEMSPFLLLGFLVAGVLSVIISRKFVESHLGGKGFKQIFKASLLGVPMPLCSCSVIPVAASLRRHGASKGATASFLASTPQTGVDSIAVTYSLLGGAFALFRVLVAFLTGILCGTIVGSFSGKDGAVEDVEEKSGCCCCGSKNSPAWRRALEYGFVKLPGDIGNSLLVGVLISAVLGAIVPDDYFTNLVQSPILTMFVMMIIGTPLYVCSTASIPIAMALMQLGVSPGAALVFLITGPATNAASISTMWKIIGRRSTLIYLLSIFICALASGLIFDALPISFDAVKHAHKHLSSDLLKFVSAIVLLALLFVNNFKKILKK